MFDDDFIIVIVVCVFCFIGAGFFISHLDKDEQKRKDIIEKTEQYEKFDNCEEISESWYCWNEE